MNIQWNHSRIRSYNGPFGAEEVKSRGGLTVALEVPEPWVLESLVIGDFITKKIGMARCSHDDNYNKKTGRELSLSRMKVMTLTVVGLHNNGTEMYVVLQDTDGHSYELEKKTNYTKVHFVGYNE